MKIYDISQEVFSSCVFPGDPSPKREELSSLENGDVCNLTAFFMCAHNGTHIDAPAHFIEGGKTVDELCLSRVAGYAYVAELRGEIGKKEAEDIMRAAREAHPEAARRILIKGKAVVSAEAAEAFSKAEVLLVGVESQTVGPEASPMEVHKILLTGGTVILEGIRLSEVPGGVYFLSAAPLKLGGADGAPCRAFLIEPE